MHLLTAYMRIVFAGRRSESPPMQAKRPGLQHRNPLIAQLVPRLPLGWGGVGCPAGSLCSESLWLALRMVAGCGLPAKGRVHV